ncbi:hypothetical protein EJV47_14920 [Hymenobacter gummosus]|uniref:Exodeoxyribonuclease X-like C-terminal domain-containing protein n=1 Tax=Hymenobacter gummosus TaxID=1776032 RepID=A0A3S0IMI3_9BACT|nr:hypothetical protein [Hymenobacter gummosus]RTQ48886.1 hypothetical protein EJV47_14920 [Hymenobacter gummosus]
MEYIIKAYGDLSQMEFGKYSDLMIFEVAEKDPTYLEWCIVNLDHFYINTDYHLRGVSLSDKAKEVLRLKAKKYDEQIAVEHNLTCADGYGKHDIDEDGICIVCGRDTCVPDSYYDDKNANDYENESDEIDKWNFEVLSGGQFGDYDSFKENGGDTDDLLEYLGR